MKLTQAHKKALTELLSLYKIVLSDAPLKTMAMCTASAMVKTFLINATDNEELELSEISFINKFDIMGDMNAHRHFITLLEEMTV